MIDKPGVYRLSMQEHHSDPVIEPSLTRSIIKLIVSGCPSHAFHAHPRLNPGCVNSSTKAMNFGTVCHSLFLEGVDIAECIDPEDYPGKRGGVPIGWTNDAIKSARDSAIDRGKIPMLMEDYEKAEAMVKAAHRQLAESELLIDSIKDDGESELSYIWEDDGVWCRIRPDWVSRDRSIILDYKTTAQSADPSVFARIILSTAIDIQAAFYTRGVKKIEKYDPKFIIMVQELEPPHLCSFLSLSPQFYELGKSKMKEGMNIWRECLLTGEWPGYPKRVCCLDMPGWASTQWEEKKFGNQLMNEIDPTADWGE